MWIYKKHIISAWLSTFLVRQKKRTINDNINTARALGLGVWGTGDKSAGCGTSPRIQAERPNESCSSAKTENLLHRPSPHRLRAAILFPYFCVTLQSLSSIFTDFTFWVARQSCEKFKAGFFVFPFFKSLLMFYTWENNSPESWRGCLRPIPSQEAAERCFLHEIPSSFLVTHRIGGEKVVSCHVTVSPSRQEGRHHTAARGTASSAAGARRVLPTQQQAGWV